MTDSGTEDAPRSDALLPPEKARRAEEAGVKKAPVDALGFQPHRIVQGAHEVLL